MTYLQLINSVLVRLREEQITAAQLEGAANPYWAFIGSAVNDAKDRVEDAWQWGALRGTDSVILDNTNANNFTSDQGVFTQFNYYEGNTIALPKSIDSHYIIHRVYSFPLFLTGFFMSQDKTRYYRRNKWVKTFCTNRRKF